jgi:hypothetical protein
MDQAQLCKQQQQQLLNFAACRGHTCNWPKGRLLTTRLDGLTQSNDEARLFATPCCACDAQVDTGYACACDVHAMLCMRCACDAVHVMCM